MDINIWDFLTLRNVILAILVFPLLTLLIFLPFSHALSKNTREWLVIFGLLGFIANGVLTVECCYRILSSVLTYMTQKPSLVFDSKLNTMVYRQEPFDFTYIIQAVIFSSITFLTWQLVDKIYPWKQKKKQKT
jgi:hypothetical protein